MYADLSLAAFLDRLASSSPEPGGGAAAALTGATAAALVSMVANLTLGKPQYASAGPALEAVRARSEMLRAQLLEAVDRDSEAFRRVMAAYGLPRGTEDEKAARRAAVQDALHGATHEPAAVVRLCREVAEVSETAARHGNPQALSDAAVAAVLADAAAQSAAFNVWINLKTIADRTFAAGIRTQIEADLAAVRAARDRVVAYTQEQLG